MMNHVGKLTVKITKKLNKARFVSEQHKQTKELL
jgi:hypothetical protein